MISRRWIGVLWMVAVTVGCGSVRNVGSWTAPNGSGERLTRTVVLALLPEDEPFSGTYRNLTAVAEELGHPEPWIFERIRMFTGVDSSSFGALINGRFPSWVTGIPMDIDEGAAAPAFMRLPSVAPLEEGENREGGVYSVLTDSAILAFEVQR